MYQILQHAPIHQNNPLGIVITDIASAAKARNFSPTSSGRPPVYQRFCSDNGNNEFLQEFMIPLLVLHALTYSESDILSLRRLATPVVSNRMHYYKLAFGSTAYKSYKSTAALAISSVNSWFGISFREVIVYCRRSVYTRETWPVKLNIQHVPSYPVIYATPKPSGTTSPHPYVRKWSEKIALVLSTQFPERLYNGSLNSSGTVSPSFRQSFSPEFCSSASR